MNRLILLVFCAGTAFYVHSRALPLQQLTAEEEREGNSDFPSEISSNDVSRWILQSRVSQFITHHSELKNRLAWISQSSQWSQEEESQERQRRLVFGKDERICSYNIPDQLPYSALGRIDITQLVVVTEMTHTLAKLAVQHKTSTVVKVTERS